MNQESEYQRIAMMLGLSNNAGDWPYAAIDRLIDTERDNGREALMKEIHDMLTPPHRAKADSSLRDQFAMAALNGFCSCKDFLFEPMDFDKVCKGSYLIADAMLAARQKERE